MYSLATSSWDEAEIESAIRVLRSGKTTMGALVEKFECSFAEYIGTKYALMVNSGSSANLLMLAGLRYLKNSPLPVGSEIIVPSVSWSTTYYPVNQLGYKLSFVDIDPLTLNISPQLIRESITRNTRGIFCVNLLGNPCDYESIAAIAAEHSLILIEDNCESLGGAINSKMLGSFGIAASHSFFFSHHICTMEGGMVTTNSRELYETMFSLRAHGWTRGLPTVNSVMDLKGDPWLDLYRFALPGYNLRPTELSAAIGIVQLEKFPELLVSRRKNAYLCSAHLNKKENLRLQKEVGQSSWFGFSIVLQNGSAGMRRKVIERLSSAGIETRPIVAGNFCRNPVMKWLDHVPLPDLSVADEISENGFFVGNSHMDLSSEIELFAEIINTVV